jgi:DNA polymerase-3 subunit beta
MKITVDRKELTKAVKAVARAANPKSTLPILGHILLVAEGEQLKMSATSLEIGINHYLNAEIKEEGSATVPAKTFLDLLTVSGNGDVVNIQVLKDQSVKMKAGTVDSKIKGFNPEDFPPMIDREELEGGYKFEVGRLTELINMTAFAASTDDSRPTLGGVLFRFDESELTMAASDGSR